MRSVIFIKGLTFLDKSRSLRLDVQWFKRLAARKFHLVLTSKSDVVCSQSGLANIILCIYDYYWHHSLKTNHFALTTLQIINEKKHLNNKLVRPLFQSFCRPFPWLFPELCVFKTIFKSIYPNLTDTRRAVAVAYIYIMCSLFGFTRLCNRIITPAKKKGNGTGKIVVYSYSLPEIPWLTYWFIEVTGCSGKIVFFHNSLQPLPRLHRCKRPSNTKLSTQCECTVTPIGW